jgi:hypothetical protein
VRALEGLGRRAFLVGDGFAVIETPAGIDTLRLPPDAARAARFVRLYARQCLR